MPGALTGRDCSVGSCASCGARYDAPGWGVGELWARDAACVAVDGLGVRELRLGPRTGLATSCRIRADRTGRARLPANATGRRVTGVPTSCRICAVACALTSRASRRRTATSRSISPGARRSSASSRALRAVPWGEVVSYGELAALAGRPGRRACGGIFCAQTASRSIVPCHRVVSANGIGGYGTLGRRAQAPAARARRGRPLTLEAARRGRARRARRRSHPTARCDRLAELSALFHAAGTVAPARSRRDVVPPRSRGSAAVARRAFALLRSLGIHVRDPHLPPPRLRPRHALPAPRRRGAAHARGARARPVSLGAAPPARAASRPASSRVSCCRGAYLRGAFLGAGSLTGPRVAASRAARADARRAPRSSRSVASVDGVRLRVAGASGARPSHTPRAGRTIEGFLARRRRRAMPCSRSRSGASSRGCGAEANRLANADHANLVRAEPAAQRQLEAARRLARRGAGVARRAAAGSRRAPPPPPDVVAAGARRAREPAGDEGRHAAPPRPAGGAGGGVLRPGRGWRSHRRHRRTRLGGRGGAPRTTSSPRARSNTRRRTGSGFTAREREPTLDEYEGRRPIPQPRRHGAPVGCA